MVLTKIPLNDLETNVKSTLIKSTDDAKNDQVINIKDTAVIGVNTDCLISWQYSSKMYLNIAKRKIVPYTLNILTK